MGTEDERQKASSFLYFMLTVIDSFTKRQEKEREKQKTNYLEIKEERLERTSTMNEHKSKGLHYNSAYANGYTNVAETPKHIRSFPSKSFLQQCYSFLVRFLKVRLQSMKTPPFASYVFTIP